MHYLAQLLALAAFVPRGTLLLFGSISAFFAGFGWLVRGVTKSGAVTGAVVCFVLLCATGFSGFFSLFAVFALTWAGTRFGYARKLRLGTAEHRTGRNALQVFANLGIATVCALAVIRTANGRWIAAMTAALAEAAADTVSSEVGQAAGGTPRLITNWKQVGTGTNGAITAVGTLAGTLAAITVGMVPFITGLLPLSFAVLSACAAILGMFADSVLGATLEGKRGLRNNGVNFLSTAIAAVFALMVS